MIKMDKALYGIFDSISNKRYNDAIPNYDNDDGVDIVECTQECKDCSYKDCVQDRCLFETCMKKITPFSIPLHTKFHTKCKFCNEEIEVIFKEGQHPFIDMPVLCEDCINKLKKLIIGDEN